MRFAKNHDLSALNSFGMAVLARYFVRVSTVDELREALRCGKSMNLPVLLLGGGSNLLLVEDYPGLVIHIALTGIEQLHEPGLKQEDVIVRAGAGENWHHFVGHCLSRGWCGLENLALIPGSVGAAPVQNIGAYGVELKNLLLRVDVMDMDTLKVSSLDASQCRFAYRDSIFKQALKGKVVILGVTFRLSTHSSVNISYPSLQSFFCGWDQTPGAADVFEAVCQIRRSRLPDPALLPNAGSFFKNPLVSLSDFQALQKRYAGIPSFPAGSAQDAGTPGSPSRKQVKIPAAWLIEQAGWKGYRQGSAGVHKDQALVLVNHGQARGEEIVALAQQIADSVEQQFAISLEAEVQILPPARGLGYYE